MTWVLAIAALGFAGTTVALALRLAGLKEALVTAHVEVTRVEGEIEALSLSQADTETRYARQIAARDDEIRALYDDLETCGTPADRGHAAIAGLKRLLQAPNS